VKPQETGKPSGAPAPQGKKPVESEKERKGPKENIEDVEINKLHLRERNIASSS